MLGNLNQPPLKYNIKKKFPSRVENYFFHFFHLYNILYFVTKKHNVHFTKYMIIKKNIHYTV